MNTILEMFFELPEFLQWIILFFLIASAVLFALILTFLLIKGVFKIRWEDPAVHKTIRIHNDGNVTNLFRFRAEAEKKRKLTFRFWMNGRLLPQENVEKVEIEEIVQPSRRPRPQTYSQAAQAERLAAAAPEQNADGKEKKKFEGAKKAQEGAKGVVAKGRQAAGLMGTLGALLPGEAGNALKSQSTALQAQTQEAGFAVSLPDQKLTEVKSVKAQTGHLIPGKKAAGKNALPADTDLGRSVITSSDVEDTEAVPVQETRTIRRVQKLKYAVSPFVSPGRDLKIDLEIIPRNYYRSQGYDYSLEIEQIVQFGEDLEIYKKEKLENQTAKIQGFSFVFRIISFLFSLLIMGLNLTWLIIFIRWISVNLT